MLNLPINELKPGMRLAKDITNREGIVLLNAGIELNSRYIYKLREMGFCSVFVYGEGTIVLEEETQVDVESQENKNNRYDSISKETHLVATETIKDIIEDIQEEGLVVPKNLSRAVDVVDNIIDEIMNNRIIVENLEEYYQPITTVGNIVQELIHKENIFSTLDNVRSYDEYTFIHSVNVCVMCITVGLALHYNKRSLKELGLGSLLHDIGKIKVPSEIIKKPGSLTAEERMEVEKHPQYAFRALKSIIGIPNVVPLVALQHHERFDGRGYPKKLARNEIHEYAKIVAVADVYDALVTDQCYRPRFKSYEAAEIIWASAGYHFDPGIVRTFMDNIVIYPVGSIVQLNNGQRGVVTKINRLAPTRPVVCLFYDELGESLNIPRKIDLMEKLTMFITKVYSSEPI